MKKSKIIKKIDENKKATYYDNLRQAANSIETTIDNWKVEMLIAMVLNKKKRAFRANWKIVDKI